MFEKWNDIYKEKGDFYGEDLDEDFPKVIEEMKKRGVKTILDLGTNPNIIFFGQLLGHF